MWALSDSYTNFYMENIAKIDFIGKILETVIRHKLHNLVEIGSKLPIWHKRDFLAKMTFTVVYLLRSSMLQGFKKIFKEQNIRQNVA